MLRVLTNPYDDGKRDCFMLYEMEAEKNQRYRALRNTVQFMLKITKEMETIDCSVDMCNFNDYMNGFANGILELQQNAHELDLIAESLTAITGKVDYKTGTFVTPKEPPKGGLMTRLKQGIKTLLRKKRQDGND